MTDQIKTFVKEHYPAKAFYAAVKFDSEYNDSTYENRVLCLAVYDKEKEELLPNKACSKQTAELLKGISAGGATNDPREDLVVIL